MVTRPLSPHLSIYKLSITMVMSIAHRISGVISYGGTVLFVAWLTAAAQGPESFEAARAVTTHPAGVVIVLGYLWSLSLHALGGLRHLLWDTGSGLDLRTASLLGWLTLLGSVLLTSLVAWLFVL